MRNSSRLRNSVLTVAALCLQLTALSTAIAAEPAAADPPNNAAQVDPPDRVARLSFIKGGVSFQSEDAKEWTDGALNRPLTSGDRLRLEPNARAELQMGPLDVQLDERSEFSILELTDDVAQLRLTDGTLYLNLRRLRDDEVVEVDTPHAAIAISKPGEYSIALLDDGARTIVRTYEGECEVTDHRQSTTIKTREQATFAGADNPDEQVVVEPAASRGAFDSWAHERSTRVEKSASSRYVDPDVVGYSDLDEHGDWVSEPDYGYVWFPRHVPVEWSPYRYGSWAWVSPWGWTWIDDAPWGFAPFHYGRWASFGGHWGWVPGPRYIRPVYAPALVAWVGVAPPHSGFSFSIAFGNGIGWFPLAPREVFVPNYYCSRRHIYNVNYSNTVVSNVYINRAYYDRSTHFTYVNRGVHNAITVVKPDTFTGSRHVRDHMIHVNQRDLRNWDTHNAIPNERPKYDRHVGGGSNPQHGGGGGGDDRKQKHERDVVMRHTPGQPHAGNAAFNRGDWNSKTPERNERLFNGRQAHDRLPTDGSQNTWRGTNQSQTNYPQRNYPQTNIPGTPRAGETRRGPIDSNANPRYQNREPQNENPQHQNQQTRETKNRSEQFASREFDHNQDGRQPERFRPPAENRGGSSGEGAHTYRRYQEPSAPPPQQQQHRQEAPRQYESGSHENRSYENRSEGRGGGYNFSQHQERSAPPPQQQQNRQEAPRQYENRSQGNGSHGNGSDGNGSEGRGGGRGKGRFQ
jgi:hypothetical protein